MPLHKINLFLLFAGQIRVHIPGVRGVRGVPLPAQLPAHPRRLRVAPVGLQGQGQHGQHALRGDRHQLLLRPGERQRERHTATAAKTLIV